MHGVFSISLLLSQAFTGTQNVSSLQKEKAWRVNVRIQGCDLEHGYLCGTMEALNVPMAETPVSCFPVQQLLGSSPDGVETGSTVLKQHANGTTQYASVVRYLDGEAVLADNLRVAAAFDSRKGIGFDEFLHSFASSPFDGLSSTSFMENGHTATSLASVSTSPLSLLQETR
ncbi:hypothetical protein SLEP1_g17834 [Rubroshorea leprosula]|uniref:Uncharacterized protein n=1 Tax=Rubroshorea leprosula TaxID=152421 RepID=A0AAV5IVJ4_9ROSI|nr:hypothetical protein SLEP1_g17834 [Rubroshorea leprosula]